MANNLTFLANDLYRGHKIMVWAHNFHIRHDNTATTSRQPTMGQWIRERFRDELYTIGLYMDRGTAAQNNRVVYPINPGPIDSMEWVMANAGSPTLFIDFLHQQRNDGNRWMFESTLQREWGVNAFLMIPRNQYRRRALHRHGQVARVQRFLSKLSLAARFTHEPLSA